MQRSEIWNNLIKIESKGSDMTEFALRVETPHCEKRSYDIRKRQSTSVQEAFKHIPIVHDTSLFLEIIQIRISLFAAHQLAKGVLKAEILRFRANKELKIEYEEEYSSLVTLCARETTRYAY